MSSRIAKFGRAAALLGGVTVALYSFAQGVPEAQWTAQEREFVASARTLYTRQGLPYTDAQASADVQRMRESGKPKLRGVPASEWSAQERALVESVRPQYLQAFGTFTEEQAQLLVESMRESSAQIMGAIGAVRTMAQQPGAMAAAAAAPPVPVAAGLSEESLAKMIAGLPTKQGNVDVTGRADGFDVNGRPYVDPEGRIIQFAFDVLTGRLSYAADGPQGVMIRTMMAGASAEPVTIATAYRTPTGWDVQTATGKRLSGSGLSVTPDGFLVSREASAFRYVPGSGIQSVAVPKGFQLARMQRGNVGATGFILLERENATGGSNTAAGLVSSAQAIGALLGVAKKEDFALMSMATGRLVPLNIEADGKTVAILSQCRKRNNLVNECQRADSVESLYDRSGFKNGAHYYWRVHWVNTPQGPLAIAKENGLADITIIDLATGNRVVAFHRALGISDWEAEQNGDGIVRVRAKMGFSWEEIADARNFLASAPAQPAPEAKAN